MSELLTPEEIDKLPKIITTVAIPRPSIVAKAQLAKVHRQDRPELREKIKEAIRYRGYTGFENYDLDCVANQILALFDVEEIRKPVT